MTRKYVLKKKKHPFYLLEREELGGGIEGEGAADCPVSREPDVRLDFRTLGS